MVDLHIHTTYSDGKQTVAEVLEKAEAQGLEWISITDHQSVGAYKELKNPEVRKLFGGKIVAGVELLFEHDGIINEVLGYGIDPEKMAKANFLQEDEIQRREIVYLRNLHSRLLELGFRLKDLKELEVELVATKKIARQVIFKDIWLDGNKAIAESLGFFDKESFNKFFWNNIESPKGKNYAYQQIESLETNSKAIRDAGGKVFMAHLFRANREDRESDKLESEVLAVLGYAVKNKLIDGIEVGYSQKYFNHKQTAFLKKFCREHNLLMSGGSDNHRPESKLAELDAEPWMNLTKRL